MARDSLIEAEKLFEGKAEASTSEVSAVKTSTTEEDFFEESMETPTDSLTNLVPEDKLRMPRLRMNLHWVCSTANLEEPSDRPKGKWPKTVTRPRSITRQKRRPTAKIYQDGVK
ncbi:unnamed protein product [Prunus armeniaca]